jgi:hypothetical protein
VALHDMMARPDRGKNEARERRSTRLSDSSSAYPSGLAWSHAGTKLAFAGITCAVNGRYGIRVMNADGSNVTKIANNDAYTLNAPRR